jgi:hypothetical protein
MKAARLLPLVLVSVVLFSPVVLASTAWLDSLEQLPPNAAYNRMWTAQQQLLQEYRALIDRLTLIAESADCDSTVGIDVPTLAIYFLGDLRAEKAVPVLLEKLSCRNLLREGIGGYDEPEMAGYPAATALVKIGIPAVSGLIEKICETEREAGIRICVGVLKQILGTDMANHRLRTALLECDDDSKRSSLATAIELLIDSSEE